MVPLLLLAFLQSPVQPQEAPDDLLRAPLRISRDNFFHSGLGLRPLDSAWILPPGRLYGRLRTTHAASIEARDVGGVRNRFAGLYHEWLGLDLDWGATEDLQLGLHLRVTGWDETLDRFTLFDGGGTPIVRDEAGVIAGTGPASQRHFNLSDVVLDGKLRLLERDGLTVALAPLVKIPVGRDQDLTHAGTTDLGTSILASLDLGRLAVHANAGLLVPIGDQRIFVHDAHVRLDPVVQGGAGLAWQAGEDLAAILQVEANTSAFGDVPFLDASPVTLVAGLRQRTGSWLFEEAAGVGLAPRASWDWMVHLAVGRVF